MKKIAIYFLLIAAVVSTGCRREVDDLFSDSASERMEKAQKAVEAALVEAPNGWEMLYFPHPEAHGYSFLCTFDTLHSMTVAAHNDAVSQSRYKEASSFWKTDASQGCVLSFDSYNEIFHQMADPKDDGVGYMGDYEFVVLETTKDMIRLKGKKHGAYIKMIRLPEDQNWKKYFQDINDLELLAYKYNDGIQMNYFNGDTTFNMTYNDGTFTYKYKDATITKGFIVTPTGWHFYTGCPMKDTTIYASDFVINDALDRLVCTNYPDQEIYFSSVYNEYDFFQYEYSLKNRWLFSPYESDANTIALWETLSAELEAKGAKLSSLAFEAPMTITKDQFENPIDTSYTYSLHINYYVDKKLFEGTIDLTYKNEDGNIKYSYKSYRSNMESLLKRLSLTQPELQAKRIANIVCGTFTAESSRSKLNMIELTLTDVNNASRKLSFMIDNKVR